LAEQLTQVSKEREEALDALMSMVRQHCHGSDKTLHSYAISANAEALLTLAGYGRVTILLNHGRNVRAALRDAAKENEQ
jgi:hypothetical protein